MRRYGPASGILGLAACQPAQQPVSGNEPLAQRPVSDPPTPPPAPGPNFGNGSAIAVLGILGRKLVNSLRIVGLRDSGASRLEGFDGTPAIRTDRSGMGDYRAAASDKPRGVAWVDDRRAMLLSMLTDALSV